MLLKLTLLAIFGTAMAHFEGVVVVYLRKALGMPESDSNKESLKEFPKRYLHIEMTREAAAILKNFHLGSWILGGFLGLVFGVTLARLTIFRYRNDYNANKGDCYSCVRCIEFCPVKEGKNTLETAEVIVPQPDSSTQN